MTTAYTSCSVCWWPNTIYYLLYTPESASRAYETIKCFSHNKVSLVAWLFVCLALLFGVSVCHCLFCTTFRHSFMVTVPVRLCKLGEFSFFLFETFFLPCYITYLCLILWFYLLGWPPLKSNWMDSRTAFTVLHPVSQRHVPQVSDSAKDRESGGGYAGMLSSFSRTGREKAYQQEETQLPPLHVVVPR